MKKYLIIIITISTGKIIEELAMEAAQQIAKRRNLTLVQVVDVTLKTTVPTYQLMTKIQLVKEEKKAKTQKNLEKSTAVKVAKLLIISSKIDKHDLQVKINKMSQLLKKKHKVQVFISTDGNKLAAVRKKNNFFYSLIIYKIMDLSNKIIIIIIILYVTGSNY